MAHISPILDPTTKKSIRWYAQISLGRHPVTKEASLRLQDLPSEEGRGGLGHDDAGRTAGGFRPRDDHEGDARDLPAGHVAPDLRHPGAQHLQRREDDWEVAAHPATRHAVPRLHRAARPRGARLRPTLPGHGGPGAAPARHRAPPRLGEAGAQDSGAQARVAPQPDRGCHGAEAQRPDRDHLRGR
jgi:hypothetical protein